jgi:TonB-dependent receptor
VQSGFTNWLAPSYGSIRDNREELREFVMGLPPGNFGFVNDVCCSTVGVYSEDAVDPNPRSTYDANEKSTAGYIQARYQFGDIVDGVVGMRAVRTKTSISGTSRVETTPGVFDFLPVEGSNSYTDWLPNASLRWHITPEVQLRLSATQTRTRPTFEQLNPSFNIGTPGGICTPGGDPFACARVGGGGNPNLRPFDSDNYDASLEYYFSRAGFAAVALFRRDLEGFIQTSQSRVIDPELGPIIINQPFNTNKGKIKGAEAQVSTFFDWNWLPEWARSFGAQANVTYLDTKIQDPDPVIGNRRIYGVSKWTYNLVGMYERGGLSARLSYNKRGRALGSADPRDPAGVQNRGDDIYRQFQRPAGRLDLSTNYTFKDNYTVFFDWTNILGNPHREDFSSARAGEPRAEYVRFLRYEETILSGGIRFRFQ